MLATLAGAQEKIILARGKSIKVTADRAEARGVVVRSILEKLQAVVGAEAASRVVVDADHKGEASLDIFIVGPIDFNARAPLTQHVREYLRRSDLTDFTLYFYKSREKVPVGRRTFEFRNVGLLEKHYERISD
jgi:hypothetical protein